MIAAIVATLAAGGGSKTTVVGGDAKRALGREGSVDKAGEVRDGSSSGSSATPSSGSSASGEGAVPSAGSGTAGAVPAGVARAARDVATPILMYHVINPPPAGAPFPGLYVPAGEFAEQMRALAQAGFHAVTLDQLWSHWNGDAPLPVKPVVVTFDNGYQSQYTNALPVLRQFGWRAVENMQLTGLPPSQGGLSEAQLKGLVSAGWELDTQGISHADLTTLDASQLRYQVAASRQTIQRRFGVPVRWFCYPSGRYDATVIAAVREAGYLGSTTVVPGWAGPRNDPYRLPRLRVLGGTSGVQLVELIAATERNAAPPPTYE